MGSPYVQKLLKIPVIKEKRKRRDEIQQERMATANGQTSKPNGQGS